MLKESEKDIIKLEPTGIPKATRLKRPQDTVRRAVTPFPAFFGITCSVPLSR